MSDKTTDKLLNELKDTKDIANFINQNFQELCEMTLSQYLEQLLETKQVTRSEIIRRSGLNQVYGYHIFSGPKKPSKPKALALAIAFGLTSKETSYLLHYAGLPQLYIRNSWDSALIYALDKHLSVMDTNELLANLSLTPLLE